MAVLFGQPSAYLISADRSVLSTRSPQRRFIAVRTSTYLHRFAGGIQRSSP